MKRKEGRKNWIKMIVILLALFILIQLLLLVVVLSVSVGTASYLANTFLVPPLRGMVKDRIIMTGESYVFGTYYYQEGGEKESLRWRIIECQSDTLVLITEDIIDIVSYHRNDPTDSVVLWSESDLRTWLNTDFFLTAFSEA